MWAGWLGCDGVIWAAVDAAGYTDMVMEAAWWPCHELSGTRRHLRCHTCRRRGRIHTSRHRGGHHNAGDRITSTQLCCMAVAYSRADAIEGMARLGEMSPPDNSPRRVPAFARKGSSPTALHQLDPRDCHDHVCGLVLLLSPPLPRWAQYLFPVWVTTLSIFVLVRRSQRVSEPDGPDSYERVAT